jgi:hypothetical protein
LEEVEVSNEVTSLVFRKERTINDDGVIRVLAESEPLPAI